MDEQKKLSRASVLRMELYLEVLEQLEREGREHVTSTEIGQALGIPPVKVRQDLFGLGSDGRPKVGYEVSRLLGMIRGLFNLDQEKKVAIVGFGNLGNALAGSNIWSRAGYRLAAIFDVDPAIAGTDFEGIRVRSTSEFFGVVKSEGIETAVLTVPASSAQETTDLLVAAGIRAIWNFTPVKLQVPESVAVENQSLVWGLITLAYSSRF